MENEGRLAGAVAEYEKAVKLYLGDYLVEDLYEDWTMVERERLANAYMNMLSRVAVYYRETEQLQEVIRVCLGESNSPRSYCLRCNIRDPSFFTSSLVCL